MLTEIDKYLTCKNWLGSERAKPRHIYHFLRKIQLILIGQFQIDQINLVF
jgi:hypothetical protein